MKVVCAHCDRVIEVNAVRVLGNTAFIGCSKCGVESALAITTEALPPLAETPKAAPPLPMSSRKTPGPRALVLASSAEASNVVMLRAPQAAAIDAARALAEKDPFAVPAGLCPKCLTKRPGHAEACPTCGLTFAAIGIDVGPPEQLASSWKELLRDWGNEGLHALVRQWAIDHGELPALARLYRLRLAQMPEDPLAQRGRDEVMAAASALPQSARDQRPAPIGAKVFVGVVSVAVIIAAVIAMMRLVKL